MKLDILTQDTLTTFNVETDEEALAAVEAALTEAADKLATSNTHSRALLNLLVQGDVNTLHSKLYLAPDQPLYRLVANLFGITFTLTHTIVLAKYSDGSGDYSVTLTGDQMTTTIGSGDDAEVFTDTITRAPQLDPHQMRLDATTNEWVCDECNIQASYCTRPLIWNYKQTDTFASSPDHGTDGVVWINNLAYDVEAN